MSLVPFGFMRRLLTKRISLNLMKNNIRYCHYHSDGFSRKVLKTSLPHNRFQSTVTTNRQLDGILTITKKGKVKKNEIIGSIETDKVIIDIRADKDGEIVWNNGLENSSLVNSESRDNGDDALYTISSKSSETSKKTNQSDRLDRKVIDDFLADPTRDNPVILYNYATYCLKTGNVARSIELFSEATKNVYPLRFYAANGTNYWTWRYNLLYNHGVALRTEGRGLEAIDIFLECAEIKRDNNVLCELGTLYFTALAGYLRSTEGYPFQGSTDRNPGVSRDYFEEVLRDDPENYLAHYYLATIGRAEYNKNANARDQNEIIFQHYRDAIKYSSTQIDEFWREQIKEQYDHFQKQILRELNENVQESTINYALEPFVAMSYLGPTTADRLPKYFQIKNTNIRRFPNPRGVVPKYQLNNVEAVCDLIHGAEEQSIVLLTGPRIKFYDANENDILQNEKEMVNPKYIWNLLRRYYKIRATVLAQKTNPFQPFDQLYKDNKVSMTITQDVDISECPVLTEQGVDNIVQLHGTISQLMCETCGLTNGIDKITKMDKMRLLLYSTPLKSNDIPKCSHCKNMLRPNVKMFYEYVDHQLTEKAQRAIKNAKIFLIIGADTGVTPAADLVKYAMMHRQNLIKGEKIVIVQIGGHKTFLTNFVDHYLDIDITCDKDGLD